MKESEVLLSTSLRRWRPDLYFRNALEEIHALLENLIIALVVLSLPWKLAFRVLRLLTRSRFFQGKNADAAFEKLDYFFPQPSRTALRLIALHRLVDMADHYLTLCKSYRWISANCRVSGEKLDDGGRGKGILFVTFHYGQGFWALRYLRENGFPMAWLHLPPPTNAPLGQKLAGWIGRRRINQVARLSGASAIGVGGSVARMKARLLEERLPVMAMPDAPPQPGQSSLPVSFLGRSARIPAGTIRMAVQAEVPVVVYTMSVNPVDGHRHLRFEAPLKESSPEALAQRLCDHLQSAIERDPTAWHMWPWASAFFDAPLEASSE